LGIFRRLVILMIIIDCTVFTYRQIMELVSKHTKRTRPILSLPFAVGKMQGFVLEKLPSNVLTLTRDQVRIL
jgi:hypothetical protein